MINSGDHSLQQNAERDINNHVISSSNKSIIDLSAATKKLMGHFSGKPTFIIDQVNDHKCLNTDETILYEKKRIKKQFDDIEMHPHDSRAKKFNEVYQNVIKALDTFVETRNEEGLEVAWSSFYEQLKKLLES